MFQLKFHGLSIGKGFEAVRWEEFVGQGQDLGYGFRD